MILPGRRHLARRVVGQPLVRAVVVAVDVAPIFSRASSSVSNSSRQMQPMTATTPGAASHAPARTSTATPRRAVQALRRGRSVLP